MPFHAYFSRFATASTLTLSLTGIAAVTQASVSTDTEPLGSLMQNCFQDLAVRNSLSARCGQEVSFWPAHRH